MNKYVKNFLLVLFTIIIALVAVELLARLFFEPIDFLKPQVVNDEVLRYRIEPNSGAHDEWGYRNKTVPDSIDVVAIGDSHTYGISATAANSWPNQLEQISDKDVYNLSLGGYGPAEYLYLMEQKAFELDPEMIVVGFYLGNDIKDSLTAVYTVPIWEDMRDPNAASEIGDIKTKKKEKEAGFTDWLSANSVIYRLVSSSFIGDNLRQQRRLSRGEEVLMLEVEEDGINTGLTPDRRLKGLDLRTPEVREGLRLTLEFFNKMNQMARANDVEFLVVILPTKESVFGDFITKSEDLANSSNINWLLQSEEVINQLVKAYFSDNNIPYIDVLDSLKEAAGKEQIYPNNFGGHSNKNGYRIIAETIDQQIKPENSN